MKAENAKAFDLRKFCEFPIPDMEQWKEVAEQSLKGRSLESLHTKTYEGIELKPIYVRKDVEDLPYLNDLPGEGSFVRGIEHLPNPTNAWEIAQEITGGSAQDFHEALVHDLNRGQTMIHVVVDDATKQGLDVEEAENLVGKNGVAIVNIDDFEIAFKNIDLQKHRLFMQTGISTLPLYASFIAFLKKQKMNLENIKALIGFDPLGVMVTSDQSKFSMKRLYSLMAELTKYSYQHTPNIKTIYVKGEHYHNAGGSATEELAFALATGVEYISEMLDRGLDINEICKQMYFSFAVGSNVFMEIAKLRAARLLWSKIVSSFGGDKEAQKMYIHVKTSSWNKTKYDPYVNILRTTTEAFAGAVGGANSMHVSPFDEAIRPADSFSQRIARNTQVILQEESLLNHIVDPAGGSWYVESLTDAVAKKAWELFQNIEKRGGMFEALKAGYVQQIIADTRKKKLEHIETRKSRIVGTNMYTNLDEKPLEQGGINEESTSSIIARLKDCKNNRGDTVQTALMEVATASSKEQSVIPSLIQAALQKATIGEMIDKLADDKREAEINKLPAYRAAECFEQLREAAEKYKQKNGHLPKIFFINLESIPKHKARADFATGFFAAGGFQAVRNDGYYSVDEAVQAAVDSGLETVVICGTDEQYEKFVPAIAKELKKKNENIYIMLAGKPSAELEQQYTDAGVDEYIHVKSNCYQTLARLQQMKGVN